MFLMSLLNYGNSLKIKSMRMAPDIFTVFEWLLMVQKELSRSSISIDDFIERNSHRVRIYQFVDSLKESPKLISKTMLKEYLQRIRKAGWNI